MGQADGFLTATQDVDMKLETLADQLIDTQDNFVIAGFGCEVYSRGVDF